MTWKRRLQRMMCNILGHPYVEMFIMGFILANTVVLALHHHEIDTKFKKILDALNLVSNSESTNPYALTLLETEIICSSISLWAHLNARICQQKKLTYILYFPDVYRHIYFGNDSEACGPRSAVLPARKMEYI